MSISHVFWSTSCGDTTATSRPLYVLNAAAVTKPHAVEHLAADLLGYKVDVAIITKTHLKKHLMQLYLC